MDSNAGEEDALSSSGSAPKRKKSLESDEEIIRTEESPRSPGMLEDDLDEFLNNAENLSDQTLGDICLYDGSLMTDFDKSLNQQTLNDESSSHPRHFSHLSCTMLDGDDSLATPEVNVEQVKHMNVKLQKQEKLIKLLIGAVNDACAKQSDDANKTKELLSQVSWLKENTNEIANLSLCSFDEKNEYNENEHNESFRISSYVKALASQIDGSRETVKKECRYAQTSPELNQNFTSEQTDFITSLCHSFLTTTKSLKNELCAVRGLMKQPFENHEDFPIRKILSSLREVTICHEEELASVKGQCTSEIRHYQEVQNTLKDEIKTLKMRLQEKIKQKDHEIAELRASITEVSDDECDDGGIKSNLIDDSPHPVHDESFGSNADEETFSSLTRTKVEYLKLTPSEYVDDEVIDSVHIPESFRERMDDYKLKLSDMEKKFEANKRYLEEQTHDREVERDEFQQALEMLQNQIDELKRENGKLFEVNKQHVYQIEEYAARLKSAEEDEMDLVQKHEKTENELKAAIEKIFELREIIRDLEKQVDSLSTSAIHLKEQNQVLMDELEKQELTNKKDQADYNETDTYGALPMDITDEIQTQLQDLAKKMEFKLNEMDYFQWHTRPNSSCSGVASAVSTEDISCRELTGRNSRFDSLQIEDVGSLLLNEVRRLETQFESLTRFEDVLMKKLKDTELRCSGQRAKIEEVENQVAIYQEKCSSQMIKIADLEGQLDSLRFESANQNVIASLKARIATASKQLEEYRAAFLNKDRELSELKAEVVDLKVKLIEKKVDQREISSQTTPVLDGGIVSFTDLTYEGASPEKMRRMETGNPLSTSVVSISNNVLKEQNYINDPDVGTSGISDGKNRGGTNSNFGGEDSFYEGSGNTTNSDRHWDEENPDSPRAMNIEKMEKMFHEFQTEIIQKEQLIRELKELLERKDAQLREAGCPDNSVDGDRDCEQEHVRLDTEVTPAQNCRDSEITRPARRNTKVPKPQGASDGDDSVYEINVASEYEAEGELLRYIGTKILSKGPTQAHSFDHGQGRINETDRQIEIATLNTQIHQLRSALDEERRNSADLTKRLKSCEDSKAELRSRSPLTRAPVQNIVSSVSVQQFQQRETARQIEEGRKLLLDKQREIGNLSDRVQDLESKFNTKLAHEQELKNRLSSTATMLRRCEEHGRELSATNQENMKEIRRLRSQLDKFNVNAHDQITSVENIHPVGNEYFDNYVRAKSHKKALAWQKKYLSSVILGYKSILRHIGHGNEHPDLLQTEIPLAPSTAGLLDRRRPVAVFRVAIFTVIAVIRMKFMVNRWKKKRPGESSPESEYRISRHSGRIDSSIIRPAKRILVQGKVNYASLPPPRPLVEASLGSHDHYEAKGGSFADMSEYLTRFESLENQISSSLTRNVFPS